MIQFVICLLFGLALCQSSIPGYKLTSITPTSNGFTASLDVGQGGLNQYGPDIPSLTVNVFMESEKRLHVKITDAKNARWEVPKVVQSTTPPNKPANPDYKFSYTGYPFGFSVTRASNNEVIFNTTSSPSSIFNGLIFKDQYLELSTQLPNNPSIYGLGERIRPLKLDTDGNTYTLFTSDEGTPFNNNLYASQPFYMEVRKGGLAHGVFLLNSNGMDVIADKTSLTYKVIGGILDFYFFTGPTPAEVVKQYLEVIGNPYLPPYWSLGFHQCRWGYHNVGDLQNVVNGYKSNQIPLETMWSDIDYMEQYKDFSFDPNNFPVSKMKPFVDGLHANNQHYIVITDPGIHNIAGYKPYEDGNALGIFIKKNGQTFIGKVWPGSTAFPDFFHPQANQYWENQIRNFHSMVPIDGLWIDMNEISNFCDGACDSSSENITQNVFDPNRPPYAINNRGNKSPLNAKTVDMDCTHYDGLLEYNVHNLYGITEANATMLALQNILGKRSVVISRSTYPGSGRHGGHWLGDNNSNWGDMYYSIPGLLNFQMFGVPLVGADICGFGGSTTEELCGRWMQLGSFYPFARNHNSEGSPSQEAFVWPSVAATSRTTLLIRYSLLPYIYTLFYQAHVNGSTVARPLFFEFTDDPSTASLDKQFLLGPGLLITPVLTEGATTVSGYFPKALWYDYYTHAAETDGTAQTKTLSAPRTKIPLHIRGGTIIPTQEPELTTTDSRKNPLGLLVALSSFGTASGSLYYDDGESIDVGNDYTLYTFSASNQGRTGSVRGAVLNLWSGTANLVFNTVNVMGVAQGPSSASLNGKNVQFKYDTNTKELSFTGLGQPLSQSFSLTWQ